ncbi:MAG: ABC transporter permease [Candidatus Eisenbacteria bacterium]|nr:ABC transporter permease [Candidatus Eisenbacteria bacterium]
MSRLAPVAPSGGRTSIDPDRDATIRRPGHGVGTIARLTLREARRRRLVLAVALMGIVFLTLFTIGFYFVHRSAGGSIVGERPEVWNFFLLTGLYVVNFLTVVLTVLASVDAIAGEIASGTIQTIVTKPIARWKIIAGRWLGLAGLVALFVALMGAAMIAIVWGLSGYVPPNPVQALALMILEGMVILSLSILGGTRMPTLANGVVVFMLYALAFIGGWCEQIGAFLRNATLANLGIVVSLLAPSEALWRRAAYLMQPPAIRQLGFGPFATATAPSPAMVVYAALYAAVLLWLAVRSFRRRDL